jgi:hypothetical protein
LLFHLFAQTPQKSWFMVLERVIKLLWKVVWIKLEIRYTFSLILITIHIWQITLIMAVNFYIQTKQMILSVNKGNNKITELRTILQRESPNS